MKIAAVLRAGAVAMALVAAIDPLWTVHGTAPASVSVRPTAREVGETPSYAETRRQLERDLDGSATFDSDAEPAALVWIGNGIPVDPAPETMPVSFVSLTPSAGANVRIISTNGPSRIPVGWTATFRALVASQSVAGQTTRIVLEQHGVEVARVEHKWTNDDEMFEAILPYAPPAEGSSTVSIRALPLAGETNSADNAADRTLTATARRFRILAHEPRPSWAAAFVRRVLEADPAFDVSSLVEASKGLEVRGGTPPATLTAESLSAFDVVVVGAPEELSAADVAALSAFAHRRGGTVVLLPDRRPFGRYAQLMPGLQFDELLVNTPLELVSPGGGLLRATEFAIPRVDAAGLDVLASVDRGKGAQPVVVSVPAGSGFVLFSGALDAWRFRAAADDGFGRFWRWRIAEAALAAPPRIDVTIEPGIARPGDSVAIRTQLRPTEFDPAAAHIDIPEIHARLIDKTGAQTMVRLWPTAELGVFKGQVTAPAAGQYDLQVSTAGGASADTVLSVFDTAQHGAVAHQDDASRLVAAATGGIAVDAADLGSLERFLRALPKTDVQRSVHPTRSLWYAIVFAALLCTEWAMRRRRGYV